jgi:hypothetical protein
MTDYHSRRIKEVGPWAIATDGLQWILQKRTSLKDDHWVGESFVSTDRVVLELCMREKGIPEPVRKELLWGLPESFEEWFNGEQQAIHRGRLQATRRFPGPQVEMGRVKSKLAKKEQHHRKPRRAQSGALRGRRR